MSTAEYQGVYEIDDLARRMVERHSSLESLADEVTEVIAQLERTLWHEIEVYPISDNWLINVSNEAKLRLALLPKHAKPVGTR